MAEQTTLEHLDAVQREVRFTLPYFSKVVVVLRDAGELPDFEDRHRGFIEVVLPGGGEAEGPLIGARLEWFRSEGFDHLVVPADVYPWLDRHEDVIRYLNGTFRRVPTDQDVCHIFALQPPAEGSPTVADDGLPIPPPELIGLVAGGLPADAWFETGRHAVTWIREMLKRNGVNPAKIDSLLDFGCGCGRVIRHWSPLTDANVFGSDYNPYLVRWCSENLPSAEFVVNGLEPPLPFDDNSFAIAYSLSIFTHLDETLQQAWFDEITRVVKPGGVFLLTFHGRSRLEPSLFPPDFEGLDEITRDFDAGKLVVWRGEQSGGSGCATWHPESYVNQLARKVEVLDYSPAGARDIEQDAVLFRKPDRLRAPT